MKILSLCVFVRIKGEDEKMVMFPNDDGVNIPLIYASHDTVSRDFMKPIVQDMADTGKEVFELREYTLSKKEVKVFYPADKSFYNA